MGDQFNPDLTARRAIVLEYVESTLVAIAMQLGTVSRCTRHLSKAGLLPRHVGRMSDPIATDQSCHDGDTRTGGIDFRSQVYIQEAGTKVSGRGSRCYEASAALRAFLAAFSALRAARSSAVSSRSTPSSVLTFLDFF